MLELNHSEDLQIPVMTRMIIVLIIQNMISKLRHGK